MASFCTKCGAQLPEAATFCSSCGTQQGPQPSTTAATPKKPNPAAIISGLVAIAFFLYWTWFAFGGGVEKEAQNEMRKIEAQVANDAVQQYNIAKQSGSPMDICVQAGMVKAAFLQANNADGYKIWTATEKVDCAKAGFPR